MGRLSNRISSLQKVARISIISLLLVGCSRITLPKFHKVSNKSQLEIREFQTRTYETSETALVMKAMLNVLQDEGFIVKDANIELGLITATKEVDVESALSNLISGSGAPKSKTTECSTNVTQYGQQVKVRVNFEIKTMSRIARVISIEQIDDPQFYQNFFAKVDKGIFLQKESL